MEESEGHSSDFLVQLQAQGFKVQFAVPFSEEEQSGFYSVLAAALSLQQSQNYPEVGPYLAHLWTERLPSFSKVAHLQDLATQGSALLSDLEQHFQSASWVFLIRKGKIPPKSNAKIWTTLADYCAFQLIWYEATSAGVITHRYGYGDTEPLRVILTLAEERPCLYLMVHVNFSGAPRAGFPFYVPALENVEIPILGVENDTSDHLEEKAEEALAHWQADIINTLLQLLSQIGVLPTDTKPFQHQIRALYESLQPFPHSINTAAIQAFLSLEETAASPQPYPSNACFSCKTVWSTSFLCQLEHGHSLCFSCCSRLQDISACLCGVPLSPQDQKKRRQYSAISLGKAI